METRPITVAETGVFLRQAVDVWRTDEHSEFIDFIARNPEAGDVIPQTGGLRKIRRRHGTGKTRRGSDYLFLLRLRHAALSADDLRQGQA